MQELSVSYRALYSAFLGYLESGVRAWEGARTIYSVDEFRDLDMVEQNTLVNASIHDAKLSSSTRAAINTAQRRSGETILHQVGGLMPWRPGSTRRPTPRHYSHLAEMGRIHLVPNLEPNDPGRYSALMVFLETGFLVPSIGRQIHTMNEFNALSPNDMNTVLTAAVGAGIAANIRAVINRVQQRVGNQSMPDSRRR
jgi:hypothetical protein